MKKRHETIDRFIEGGIYLFIVFMFLTKGEGIRNILIFGNLILWLFTIKHRKNLYLLREHVSILLWIFTGLTIVSVIFSIDPLYSFLSLRNEPLKPAILFIVISTVMSDSNRLRRVTYVCLFTALLIVSIGYYSYIFHDISVLKPDTALMHAWHNKFARYLNTLLPFAFILYFILHRPIVKVLLVISIIISVFALILSTSREGYLAFFSIACIWAVYISKTKKHNIIKVLSVMVSAILILGIISWFSFPHVRQRISQTTEDLPSLNLRTSAWIPAIYAIKQKPLFGWGHGKRIFHQDEPYKDTPYKKAPPIGPHNTFIKILFHQGLMGALPYILLILLAIKIFWKKALKTKGIKSYILVACVSVLVGNYILNSMFTVLRLRYLAVILGLGIAAIGIDEDSHN